MVESEKKVAEAIAAVGWFGKRCKELRESMGLSQAEVAEKMQGVLTRDGLAKLERGEIGPRWLVVATLSAVLGVDCVAFMQPPGKVQEVESAKEQPKRPRGRPRKEPKGES